MKEESVKGSEEEEEAAENFSQDAFCLREHFFEGERKREEM